MQIIIRPSLSLFPLIAFMLLQVACGKIQSPAVVDFEIANNTDRSIDLVYLSTVHQEAKTREANISPRGMCTIEMKFIEVGKSDGCYSLFYRYADSPDIIRHDFGYYTNGFPLDKIFHITIYTDSVSVKSGL